jgi:hypothetical protein
MVAHVAASQSTADHISAHLHGVKTGQWGYLYLLACKTPPVEGAVRVSCQSNIPGAQKIKKIKNLLANLISQWRFVSISIALPSAYVQGC